MFVISNKGFMLVEALVSVFIVSLICLLLMSVMSTLATSVTVSVDEYLTLDIRNQLNRDLAFANSTQVAGGKLIINKPTEVISYEFKNNSLWRRVDGLGNERILSDIYQAEFLDENNYLLFKVQKSMSSDVYKYKVIKNE